MREGVRIRIPDSHSTRDIPPSCASNFNLISLRVQGQSDTLQLPPPAHACSGEVGPPAPRPASAAMPSAHARRVRVPASVGRVALPQGAQLPRPRVALRTP